VELCRTAWIAGCILLSQIRFAGVELVSWNVTPVANHQKLIRILVLEEKGLAPSRLASTMTKNDCLIFPYQQLRRTGEHLPRPPGQQAQLSRVLILAKIGSMVVPHVNQLTRVEQLHAVFEHCPPANSVGTPREAQLAAHSQKHVLPIPHVLLVINARNDVMGQRRDKPWEKEHYYYYNRIMAQE
jgi:hypothetical protein